MEAQEQVEQLQAALESKEAQVAGLHERVKELGAYRQEALDAREAISKHVARISELEDAVQAAKREAGEAKSVLAGIQAKNDAAQAKLEAAIKVSEGLKALL